MPEKVLVCTTWKRGRKTDVYQRQEYPQYTRPEEWHGMRVPQVLLSGHHANIRAWRAQQALERTRQRRPDLYEAYLAGKKDGETNP